MIDMRTPHNLTILYKQVDQSWAYTHLTGVKVDLLTARGRKRFGLESADKVRVIIYLDSVVSDDPDWQTRIIKGSYFTDSIVLPPATPGQWKKELSSVWEINQSQLFAVSIPMLHHFEIIGR